MDTNPALPPSASRARTRSGVYWLPSLLTTVGLFCGFLAMVLASRDQFAAAAAALFAAMLADGLDGRVARLTGTQSAFGAEYDSLADVIAFGVAPALALYWYCLDAPLAIPGLPDAARAHIGWLAAFVYLACAALRLARFNVQPADAHRRWFVGLPSPAAAALPASLLWLASARTWSAAEIAPWALLLLLAAAVLMVTRLPYRSFKDMGLRGRVRLRWLGLAALALAVLALVVITLEPALGLLLLALGYALSAPMLWLWRLPRRLVRRS